LGAALKRLLGARTMIGEGNANAFSEVGSAAAVVTGERKLL
jgi:hypothetical protein